MIVRVARQAQFADIGRVVVATDTLEVAKVIESHGLEAVMTRLDHQSGSDRIYEALFAVDPEGRVDVIVNVQGDLPTIDPAIIRQVTLPLENALRIWPLWRLRSSEKTRRQTRMLSK